MIGDLIEGGSSGAFEAPTGLGKSLAALIPAIAHALVSGRRTVIATYTNVLAEQYWRQDLPLARLLFEGGPGVRASLLMGRTRYVCLAALQEHAKESVEQFRQLATIGHESDFRRHIGRPARELGTLWSKVSTPPVCPARLCPHYDNCFYYGARKRADRADIVITNHSVVLSDAVMKRDMDDSDGLLGDYDFLVIDEAHDFPTAATDSLEFELSETRLSLLTAVSHRMEFALDLLAQTCGDLLDWKRHCVEFREALDACQKRLAVYSLELGRPGILTAAPPGLLEHPQVRANRTADDMHGAKEIATQVSDACEAFVKGAMSRLDEWEAVDPEQVGLASDTIRNYISFLRDYGIHCFSLFDPQGVAVSYLGQSGNGAILRQDLIDLADPLTELIWERTPYVCMSATLALDGAFEYFRRVTGARPQFEEILPSPFEFSTQAALYLPPTDRIPDPSLARRQGSEEAYWRRLADELTAIISTVGGRTLALFHSRKEMEAVYRLMALPQGLPIYIQGRFGAASVGERFKGDVRSSLFALRSYWTGFDAPGETLSCVVLVRVPFEVPIEPPAIARVAFLQIEGRDAFAEHTLPQAKMIMRQGAGRLIRRSTDRGLIAILDPRVTTKRYGEEILANMPPGISTYRDIEAAAAAVGLI